MQPNRTATVVAILLMALSLRAAGDQGPQVVTLESPAPLVQVHVMVRAGSAADPQGLEGLAYLTARALIDGGFGDPKRPVTKEKLAEITRPWGQGAQPGVRVSKESTIFSMTVPREVVGTYVRDVLQPLFTRPLFAASEVERLKAETLQGLRSNLRLEQIELLGLVALDNVVHEGTAYAHPHEGTEKGLEQITQDAVRRFYATHYKPEHLVLALSTSDPAIVSPVRAALAGTGAVAAQPLAPRPIDPPSPVRGREVLIVALPNAISTGLHAGFPIPVTRAHPDYWPLYVANIWFGTHRDEFSHLYQAIRAERGYNYGDYSYIEHFEGRPFALFPPTGYPRLHQYFSIWIRPVQHDYAYHLLKAMTWELENFVRTGLTDEQCELAKNKARVLYLSLAETTDRLLGDRLDSQFYGLEPGYLDGYLQQIDGVTCRAVNGAIRAHLQPDNLEFVVITHRDVAPKLAAEIAGNAAAWGKAPADYQIDVKAEGGQKTYAVPEDKLRLLQQDGAWAHYWLNVPKDRIRIVTAEKMFETGALPK